MVFGENFSKIIVLFLLAIIAMHAVAVYFSLYWIVWWFDNVMHFLGGIWMSFFAVWFLYFSGKMNLNGSSIFSAIIIILGITALGAVLWEFFEFSFDKIILGRIEDGVKLAGPAQLGVADTMSDLFFGLLGGLAGGLFFIKNKKYGGKNQ